MAFRTTTEEVEELTGIVSDSSDLEIFIRTANVLVDNLLLGKGLSDETLAIIEAWLAAHFAKIREMHRSSEKIGDAQDQYQFKVGLNLQVTMYGQQALTMDPSGCLNSANKGQGKAKFMFEHISNEKYRG